MLNLSNLKLIREPYPIASIVDILPTNMWELMVKQFPHEIDEEFIFLNGGYNKYSLSERNNPKGYQAFINSNWIWQGFYYYIKSMAFITKVLKALSLKGTTISTTGKWSSRFEFSSLPADGGYILPHTDIPTKVITIVIGMDDYGYWKNEWGGGTDILYQKNYNEVLEDYKAPLDKFHIAHTFKHEPNEGILFIKSNNSWHSVGPIKGPLGYMRRTLTINIERSN